MLAAVFLESGIVGYEERHFLALAVGQHIAQLAGTLGALNELLGSHVGGSGFDVFDLNLLAGNREVRVAGTSIAIAALASQSHHLLLSILIDAAHEEMNALKIKLTQRCPTYILVQTCLLGFSAQEFTLNWNWPNSGERITLLVPSRS